MNVLNQASGERYTLYHGDCIPTTAGLPDNSIDFCIHSPPFANLYIYSDSKADMGNAANSDEFMEHYGYLIKELYRVTVPGRLGAVHCKDLPLYRNRDGASGLDDFPGDIIRAFKRHGWVFHSRTTIWKDPVIEMQRTKNHGLLHKNFTERADVCRQGMADYLITFRKWEGLEANTESIKPVKHHKTAPETKAYQPQYVGTNPPAYWDSDRDYSIQVWQRYASPVWFDIDQTDVLNYEVARDNADEKHICPLQLGVIRRAVDLWTNPGDVVYSPFAGIGSEGVVSLEMGRKFVGVELKESYWRIAANYLQSTENAAQQMTMLDMLTVA
jgi:DNA modification methylase